MDPDLRPTDSEPAGNFYAAITTTGTTTANESWLKAGETFAPNHARDVQKPRPEKSNCGHGDDDIEGCAVERLDERGIGYRLLCKAGYRGAGGLGAQEQGVTSPLKAWRQAGKQGIGRPKREAILQAETTGKTSSELVVPLGVKARSAVSCSNSCEDEKMRRAQIKRKWPSVNVEESVDAKKRPWRQVLQAEADTRAGNEVDRLIFRLFRDDNALDTSPLMRRHKLSSRNPLG